MALENSINNQNFVENSEEEILKEHNIEPYEEADVKVKFVKDNVGFRVIFYRKDVEKLLSIKDRRANILLNTLLEKDIISFIGTKNSSKYELK